MKRKVEEFKLYMEWWDIVSVMWYTKNDEEYCWFSNQYWGEYCLEEIYDEIEYINFDIQFFFSEYYHQLNKWVDFKIYINWQVFNPNKDGNMCYKSIQKKQYIKVYD